MATPTASNLRLVACLGSRAPLLMRQIDGCGTWTSRASSRWENRLSSSRSLRRASQSLTGAGLFRLMARNPSARAGGAQSIRIRLTRVDSSRYSAGMKNLQSLLEKFASEIETAVRAELVQSIVGKANGLVPTHPLAMRMVLPRTASPAGAKRAPEELDKLCELVLTQVELAPKSNMEQIGAALGVSTRELVLPIKKLLASKQLNKLGQKRATRYTAA